MRRLQVLDDGHDAEDAFQATFLVLSRKASSIKKQQSVGSWLFGVANHAAMDLKRKCARRRLRENQGLLALRQSPSLAKEGGSSVAPRVCVEAQCNPF